MSTTTLTFRPQWMAENFGQPLDSTKYYQVQRQTRRHRAATYWEQQDNDGCYYTFSEYDRYLGHGSWSQLQQDRAKRLAQEQVNQHTYQQEQLRAKMERQIEQDLRQMLLDPYYLEEPDTYSEIDSEDEGWVSDPESGDEEEY